MVLDGRALNVVETAREKSMSYLTDIEKRLLFSALSREIVICQKLDDSSGTYEDRVQLTPIVRGLERKFYYDRFEREIRNKAIDELSCKLMMYFADCQLIEENAIVRDILDGVIERIDEIAERLKGKTT